MTRIARKRESTGFESELVSSFPKPRHSRASGNPPKIGPRFRGDDIVLVLDGKPVILVPASDRVENPALHRIGGVG